MPVKSELRMHQYIIIKDISKNKTESGTFYHSSLSHLTLNKTMGQSYDKTKIELLKSWLCPGNSSFRKTCRPKEFFKFYEKV